MDSVDQIAALTRKWGGNPEKLYGDNLPAIESRLNGINRFFRQSVELERKKVHGQWRTKKANPYIHASLLSMVEEVALALNVLVPDLYIARNGSATANAALPVFHELIISETATALLNDEKLKALIGHEICHFKQKGFNPALTVTVRAIDKFSERLLESEYVGGSIPYRLLERYAKYRTPRGNQREYEADAAGAILTSPASMADALCELVAYDLRIEQSLYSQEALSTIREQCDLLLSVLPLTHKVLHGNVNVIDRIEHLRDLAHIRYSTKIDFGQAL